VAEERDTVILVLTFEKILMRWVCCPPRSKEKGAAGARKKKGDTLAAVRLIRLEKGKVDLALRTRETIAGSEVEGEGRLGEGKGEGVGIQPHPHPKRSLQRSSG